MSEPPGWRSDKLSEFLAAAHDNTLAAFANLKPAYERLRDLDAAFRSLLDNLEFCNVKEVTAGPLCFRAHACFLGSARLSLAGQLYEAAAVCRAALESALYGLFVARTEGAAEVWMNRDADRQKARAMFTAGAVLTLLDQTDPVLGASTRGHYDTLIDLGAHPNPLGVLGLTRLARFANGFWLGMSYLPGDSVQLRLGLKVTAETGLASLGIACLVYPTRSKILRLGEQLERLAKDL